MSDDKKPRRRDFLTTAAFVTTGIGASFALWPLIAALGPTADALARRVTFDIRDLKNGVPAFADSATEPLMIFRRTQTELAWLNNPPYENKTRVPNSPVGYAFRDRDSQESNQPEFAQNWHRSLRPEIMICNAQCTHEGCVVRKRDAPLTPPTDHLQCPCCGSQYDLAGRAFSGPSPGNLKVPNYRFIDETTIELAAERRLD